MAVLMKCREVVSINRDAERLERTRCRAGRDDAAEAAKPNEFDF